MKPFELYAIHYGNHTHRTASDNYLTSCNFEGANSDLDYFVWVARRERECYVIDTGFDEAEAIRRGRNIVQGVADGLARIGVIATEVRHVILTHLHYDHAGGIRAFPNAIFHIQDRETAYAFGRRMTNEQLRAPFDLTGLTGFVEALQFGRVQFHDGDQNITEGLSLYRIGGHTGGLQIVRVFTKRGWVVVASDALHLYGNLEQKKPFPAVSDIGEMLAGYEIMAALADSPSHIIAGHDPLVISRYAGADKLSKFGVFDLTNMPIT